MIEFIAGVFVCGLVGVGIMCIANVSSVQSRLEESNPPFNLETPSRPAQAELEAFWEER
jgi:hypothetical protein